MDRRWGVVAAFVLAVGCKQGIELGEPCELTSDCAEGRVCRFELCRVECRESRDCEGGQLCLTLDDGLGACRLPEQDGCASDADCAAGLRCRDERCTTECASDADCGAGAVCRDDGCERSLLDGGAPDGGPPRDDGGAPVSDDIPEGRVTSGVMMLYDFVEHDLGAPIVFDVSGSATPVHLTIENAGRVAWGDGFVTIYEPTRILSSTPAPGLEELVQQVVTGDEVTIELWITPQSATQLPEVGPARIAAMSEGPPGANFVIGQGAIGNGDPYDQFSLRLRTAESTVDGQPGLETPRGVVDTTRPSHLVVTHDAAGWSCIYLHGVMSQCAMLAGQINSWAFDYALVLGNEPEDERPWLGSFHLFAIYGRALTAEEVRQNYDAGHGT